MPRIDRIGRAARDFGENPMTDPAQNDGRQGDAKRRRHRGVLIFALALMLPTTALSVYAPTLYRMFCNLTGYGGTVQRATAPVDPAAVSDATVTVAFDANVAPGLAWSFQPEQRSVVTRFGEPTRVYYTAKNLSDETVVARATFNVTPDKTAPYFFKIECFCFTEERLGPGESARMPLVLYVDEEMLNDPDARQAKTITLSYTFFRQDGLSPDEIAAARELAGESEALDTELSTAASVEFRNDAPRGE
jgi:cytochrome c oxidase assembly protein subunit 11